MEINLLSAIVSAILGVAAAVIGAWFAGNAQRRQWRDDLRLNSYVDLLRDVRGVLYRGGEVGSGGDEKSRLHEMSALRDALEQYRSEYNRVRLVGPPEVAVANENLHDYITYDLATWFENRQSRHPEDAPEVIRARELLDCFLTTAEQALALTKGDDQTEERLGRSRRRRSR